MHFSVYNSVILFGTHFIRMVEFSSAFHGCFDLTCSSAKMVKYIRIIMCKGHMTPISCALIYGLQSKISSFSLFKFSSVKVILSTFHNWLLFAFGASSVRNGNNGWFQLFLPNQMHL